MCLSLPFSLLRKVRTLMTHMLDACSGLGMVSHMVSHLGMYLAWETSYTHIEYDRGTNKDFPDA